MMTIVLSSVLSAVVCLGIYILVTKYVTKKTIKALREAARKEAEAEGEMIKKEKILQAKEKFIQLKSEHDRQVNERNPNSGPSRSKTTCKTNSANWKARSRRTPASKSRWKRSFRCSNTRRRRSTV